jgi:hypothetical protein
VAAAAKRLTRRDYQRWARRGSTEARGYGHLHRKERERRLALYRPGDPCAHCGQPMLWWPLEVARRFIDLPHAPGKAGYLPGLACRKCNRSDGQRMTTAILRARRGQAQAVRAWQQARRW